MTRGRSSAALLSPTGVIVDVNESRFEDALTRTADRRASDDAADDASIDIQRRARGRLAAAASRG